MIEKFTEMLAAGGHANSLGRVNEVIELVLHDKSRLDWIVAANAMDTLLNLLEMALSR